MSNSRITAAACQWRHLEIETTSLEIYSILLLFPFDKFMR